MLVTFQSEKNIYFLSLSQHQSIVCRILLDPIPGLSAIGLLGQQTLSHRFFSTIQIPPFAKHSRAHECPLSVFKYQHSDVNCKNVEDNGASEARTEYYWWRLTTLNVFLPTESFSSWTQTPKPAVAHQSKTAWSCSSVSVVVLGGGVLYFCKLRNHWLHLFFRVGPDYLGERRPVAIFPGECRRRFFYQGFWSFSLFGCFLKKKYDK